MGCGSSSLKGEDVTVNGATPTPAPRRVNTNFTNIDYDQDANQGRRMTEYAPHETAKAKKSHDASRSAASGRPSEANDGRADLSHPNTDKVLAADPLSVTFPHDASPSAAGIGRQDTNPGELRPYKTNGEDGWDQDDPAINSTRIRQSAAPVNGTDKSDPTSLGSKRHFADENDPASVANQESHREKDHHPHSQSHSLHPTTAGAGAADGASPQEDSDARKKSWLGDKYSKYHATKHGKNVTLSDEDLKKYTGKDRQELNDWAEGRAVGENQPAGRNKTDYSWGA